jgi:hypothetical protein
MHVGKVRLHMPEYHVCWTKCCSLDGVIRAYVHTDYSSFNPAQHTSRKQPTSKLAITPSRLSDTSTQEGSSGSITPTNKRTPQG